MTRKKVKLAFIANDSARKSTFKKRKKGLMKKVSELSTLCGIDACAIIYSPYEAQPDVWPNNLGVQRVLNQFKRMPEMEQSKKMINQEGFIKQRIAKASDQLKKQHRDNREKEITQVMYQCLTGKGPQGLSVADLNDLGWMVERNLKAIRRRIESLKGADSDGPWVAQAGAPAPATGGGLPAVPQRPGADALGPQVGQRLPWMTEWMNNPNENAALGGEEMALPMPFGDNVHGAMWSSSFFP
ncbi:hypothetical protein NMG60_11032347 [Bertholletia excelsa]